MNRQQFLAELNQYLTFFSPEEKAKIISAYNERFDTAGPDCEATLLAELGTPMMTAIDLKRRVEAGEKITFAEDCACQSDAPDPLSEYSVETETEETLENQEDPFTTAAEPEAVPDETPKTPFKHGHEHQHEHEHEHKKVRPSGAKFVFALIGATLLSVVIAAIFLVVAAVGVGLLVAMGYLVIAGLKSLVYVTDALLLFGGGLVCMGFGLIIIWFAVWTSISLISKLYRGAYKAGLRVSDKECEA